MCFARQEKLNAIDEFMNEELTTAFQRIAEEDHVRFVILKADGRAFSAGAALRWMQRASNNFDE